MNLERRTRKQWYKSLHVRAVVLLTLAMLPLGLIAILQSKSAAETSARSSEAAILSLTERAAISERLVIEKATGAAKLLAALQPTVQDDPSACERTLARFVEADPRFSFAGIIPLSGLMTCSSSGNTFDFSQMDGFAQSMAAKSASVAMNRNGALSQQSGIIISEPYLQNGEFAGYASISVPHDSLLPDVSADGLVGLEDIITFNERGDVLTSKRDLDTVVGRLPSTTNLANLVQQNRATLFETDQLGEDRIFAMVPIRDGTLYVLGVWDPDKNQHARGNLWVSPAVFPILMWGLSLVVAYFAIHRLVARHVQYIRNQMTRFAQTRAFEPSAPRRNMSTELFEIDEAFGNMAASIIKDETALEQAVREKNVLIKEIHHRVKNNLQLISSIINMQVRETDSAETKASLRSVQERVLNMAVIPRDPLSDQNLERSTADRFISDIVCKNPTVVAALETGQITLDIQADSVHLNSNQKVPFSLLIAELASNAAQTCGEAGGAIKVSYRTEPNGQSIFCISTTRTEGAKRSRPEQRLSDQLIKAFVLQLEATLSEEQHGSWDVTTLRFRPQDASNVSVDY